jgi:hypothetical protein
MYKKLHKAEIVTSSESLPTKGSFFVCVPERGIMLTKHVYPIQLKKQKKAASGKVAFFYFTTLSNDTFWHLE